MVLKGGSNSSSVLSWFPFLDRTWLCPEYKDRCESSPLSGSPRHMPSNSFLMPHELPVLFSIYTLTCRHFLQSDLASGADHLASYNQVPSGSQGPSQSVAASYLPSALWGHCLWHAGHY